MNDANECLEHTVKIKPIQKCEKIQFMFGHKAAQLACPEPPNETFGSALGPWACRVSGRQIGRVPQIVMSCQQCWLSGKH